MHFFRRVVLVIAVSMAVPTLRVEAASTPRIDAALGTSMIALVNQYRSSQGLPPLRVDQRLERSAQRWAVELATDDKLEHNFKLGKEIRGRWSLLGENVGRGRDVFEIEDAFLASPTHRQNIVEPRFNAIAIAVAVTTDGDVFVAQHFADVVQRPARNPPTTRRIKSKS